MKNAALYVAGIIFLLIAVLHLVRLFYKIEVVAGGFVLPLWFSVAGLLLATLLSYWMFRASR